MEQGFSALALGDVLGPVSLGCGACPVNHGTTGSILVCARSMPAAFSTLAVTTQSVCRHCQMVPIQNPWSVGTCTFIQGAHTVEACGLTNVYRCVTPPQTPTELTCTEVMVKVEILQHIIEYRGPLFCPVRTQEPATSGSPGRAGRLAPHTQGWEVGPRGRRRLRCQRWCRHAKAECVIVDVGCKREGQRTGLCLLASLGRPHQKAGNADE